MFNCYRRCGTIRELVDFCSGYYPNIAKWVRKLNSKGVDKQVILGQLRAIKNDIIREHELKDLPHEYILSNIYK